MWGRAKLRLKPKLIAGAIEKLIEILQKVKIIE